MRFEDDDVSQNIGSQRGEGGGGGGLGGFGGGGLGGNIIGLIAGLVISRFGIGGIVVLVILAVVFGGGLGGLTDMMGGGTGAGPAQQQRPAQQVAGSGSTRQGPAEICATDPTTRFACQAYTSTERVWAANLGPTWRPARLWFYDRRGRSGCGAADSAMGPFYCPADQGIYLDTAFFQELSQRFQAPGDFAQAYVIAHEMGHHIQYLTGTNDRIRRAQQAGSEAEGNALQVRMELQADCYAGAWAAMAQRVQGRGAGRAQMDAGDLEEGLRAAQQIGDDTLQEAAGRRPVPESFTHGTAAQRQAALRQGYEGGRPEVCASFMQGV